MNKCVYCQARKGKRACPALGGLICSQCCGEHRLSRIACLPDCVYLDTGQEYQQKRLSDHFAQARREFYKELIELSGEKAAALFNLIEVVTFSYFQSRHDGQDGDVIAAIQTLRRTLSPLHIPAAPPQAFAERLKHEYETFAKQQPQQTPDTQISMDVMDLAVTFVTEFSGGAIGSQRFLTGLLGYIKTHHPDIADHLAKQAEGGRIVLPGHLPPGSLLPTNPLGTAGHVHAGHEHHHGHRH